MKNIINNVVDSFFKSISSFYKAIDKDNIISFSEIKENSVVISYTNKEIFGFNLRGTSNIPFEDKIGNFILEKSKDYDCEILLNIIKNNINNNIYLYVTNSEFAEIVSGILNLPKMTGEELIKSFAEYFYYFNYKIELNTLINTEEKTILDIAKNNLLFHNLAEFAVSNLFKEKKHWKIFQITSYKKNIINSISELLSVNYEGIISLSISNNVNAKNSFIIQRADYNRKVDDELNKIYSKIVKNESLKSQLYEENVLISGFFIGDNASMGMISDKLGFNFMPNNLDGIDIYKNTLLKMKKNEFTFFIPQENISYLINTTLKYIEKPYFNDIETWDIPDVYAKDYSNSFINYAFKKNTNPHLLIVGETGSGKTTATLNILHKALLFNEEFKSKLLEDDMVALRYFDIDYSAGGFIKKIKENYPDKVSVKTELKDIKFNLIDIEVDENGRLDDIKKNLIITFIDMILELIKNPTLTASERNLFSKAVEFVYSKKYNKPDYSLGEISSYDKAYSNLIKELYSKGYNQYTKVSELPKEYDYLKKPTLKDLIDYLNKELGNVNLNEIQKNALIGLRDKLNSLMNLKIFEFLPNTDISKNKEIFYQDLSEFRKNTELFVSIVWLSLMTFIDKDKKDMFERLNKGLSKKKIFYVMEEAHNFLKIKSLKDIFSDFLKELRKYNIYLVFLIHKISDIDETIYKSIATKFFLFKSGSYFVVEKEINEYDKLDKSRKEIFDKVKSMNRGIFVIHSNGADAIRFEISSKVLKHLKQEKL